MINASSGYAVLACTMETSGRGISAISNSFNCAFNELAQRKNRRKARREVFIIE
jgi:hypothetical protein